MELTPRAHPPAMCSNMMCSAPRARRMCHRLPSCRRVGAALKRCCAARSSGGRCPPTSRPPSPGAPTGRLSGALPNPRGVAAGGSVARLRPSKELRRGWQVLRGWRAGRRARAASGQSIRRGRQCAVLCRRAARASLVLRTTGSTVALLVATCTAALRLVSELRGEHHISASALAANP